MPSTHRPVRRHSPIFLLISLSLVLTLSPVHPQDPGLPVLVNKIAGAEVKIGRQYAVLIAIDKYDEMTPLRSPVNDAKAIKSILERRYFIDEFIELYNGEATSSGIRRLMSGLIDRVGLADQVLVYFAGHGYMDKESLGYWIPADGGKDVKGQKNWITNAQIRNFITQMKARSVFLITDSCFSPALLSAGAGPGETPSPARFPAALTLTSRQVLVSGKPDYGAEESEFSRQVIAILENNTKNYFEAQDLKTLLRKKLSKPAPLLGTLQGHKTGGTYMLFLRDGNMAAKTDFGVLDLLGPTAALDVEVISSDGTVIKSENPLHYELKAGNYVIRAKHSEDTQWSWKGTATVMDGAVVTYEIPKVAISAFLTWKLASEQSRLTVLRTAYEESVGKRQESRNLGKTGLLTGGISAVVSGLVYFLGNSAMAEYRDAETADEASSLRNRVKIYNALFVSSSTISAMGLGLGGLYYLTAPDPADIEAQIQASLEKLRLLEQEKIIGEVK
jgi:hypothetical protein